MNILELYESDSMVPNNIEKYATRTARKIDATMKPWYEARGEKIVVTKLADNKYRFTIDFLHWMRPETIRDVNDEFDWAIKKADVEGHIFEIEDGGHGELFVEAMLSGLKPGMKLTAEAFFPTVERTVTWKTIMRKAK